MRICPLCGSAVHDEEIFCPGCGRQMENAPAAVQVETAAVHAADARKHPAQEGAQNASADTAAKEQTASEPQKPEAVSTAEPVQEQGKTACAPSQAGSPAQTSAPHTGSQQPFGAPAYAPQPNYHPAYAPAPGYAPRGGYAAPQPGCVPPQPGYAQQGYSAPNAGYPAPGYPPVRYAPYQNSDPVTMGQWLLNYLILCVPIANIVMLFVWAFGSEAKPSQQSWARAMLIWMGIGIAFTVLVIAVVVVSVGTALGSWNSFYY